MRGGFAQIWVCPGIRPPAGAAAVLDVLRSANDVLGVLELKAPPLDAEVEEAIADREAARAVRDFKRADEISHHLRERGIVLEDTPQGLRWKRG